MTTIFEGPAQFSVDPPQLLGSRDPQTGQVFFPPRELSVDGTLRRCENISLSRSGELYAFTKFAGTVYGQIDLPEQVRVLTTLADGNHETGAVYEFEIIAGEKPGWRFRRA